MDFVAELVKDLEENKPTPNLDLLEETQNEPSENGVESNETSYEETFDSSIHATDGNGNPVYNKDGSYRKRRGRKPKTETNNSGNTNANSPKARELSNKEAGKIATMMVVTPTIMFLGEDVEPTQTEFNGMANAWAAYFEEQGISNVPAWVLVATSTAAWIGPKLIHKPEPRNRLKDTFNSFWLKTKYVLGITKNALSSNRNDRKRKNNTSKNDLSETTQTPEPMFGSGPFVG